MQGGDHGEYSLLLRPFQVGLEAHQIIDGAVGVVFAQLHHRVGIPACFGIRQALGLQGSEAQRVLAAAGHHLHRHTALKHIVILEAVDLRLLCGNQRLPEGQILLPVHGTVDVIRRALVIAAGKVGAGHIHTVKGHQRRGSVKEVEGIAIPQQYRQLVRQCVGGQGAGGDDHIALRDLGHFLRHHRDIGVAADGLRHHSGKTVAVHRQRTAGRHRRGVGAPQDQAVQPPQLLFQQAYGVFQTRAPQRIGAAQLGKIVRHMGRRPLEGLHLPQRHLYAPLGQLPRALAARKASADYSHSVHSTPPFSADFLTAVFFAAVVFFVAAAFLAAGFFAAVFVVVFLAADFFAAVSSAAGSAAASPPSAASFLR